MLKINFNLLCFLNGRVSSRFDLEKKNLKTKKLMNKRKSYMYKITGMAMLAMSGALAPLSQSAERHAERAQQPPRDTGRH